MECEYTTEYKTKVKQYEVGYIGKTKESLGGYEFEVLGIVKDNRNRFAIMFLDSFRHIRTVDRFKIKTGSIKNPYHKTVCGVGFLGVGKYKVSKNGCHTDIYNNWVKILKRCYNENESSYPIYGLRGIKVCEEWHNFQNFAVWYNNNLPNIDCDFGLDKDLMSTNEKLYSPNNCIFIPKRINIFISKCSDEYFNKMKFKKDKYGKIRVRVNDFNTKSSRYIKYTSSTKDAISTYKKEKLKEIEKAKEYMRSFGIYSEEIVNMVGGKCYG